MKLFLTKIISYFLVISFVYGFVFIITVSTKAIKPLCELETGTKNLIIGDSHIMWGINDNYIPNTQNIALNGECYMYSYVKLKYILNNNVDVQNVFLGLSYHNLSKYFDDYIYGEKALQYFFRYVDVIGFEEYSKLFRTKPSALYKISREVIKTGISGIFREKCEFFGSFPNKRMLQTTSLERVKIRIEDQYYVGESMQSFSEINLFYLDKIIQLCNNYQIGLIGLNTPLQKDYKKLIPQKFIVKYYDLVHSYGITVVEFENFELPDSCFLPDGDHLNYYGAKATSKELARIFQKKTN